MADCWEVGLGVRSMLRERVEKWVVELKSGFEVRSTFRAWVEKWIWDETCI